MAKCYYVFQTKGIVQVREHTGCGFKSVTSTAVITVDSVANVLYGGFIKAGCKLGIGRWTYGWDGRVPFANIDGSDRGACLRAQVYNIHLRLNISRGTLQKV